MLEFLRNLRRKNLSVWKEVLGPTLILGCIWLAVSTSTTIFIAWQDRIFDELLVNNVSQIRLISDLQSAAWELQAALQRRLLAIPGVPDFQGVKLDETERHRSRDEMARELSESQQRLERLLAEWRRMGGSKHQQDADQVASVAQQMTQMVPGPGESSVGLQQKLLSMTQTLDSRLAELLTGHSREVSERNAQFQSWTRVVLGVRQFFNLLGPVFGLYLGYRAASRLRKQISRISLRLGGEEVNLGAVELSPEAVDPANLDSLELQVGLVEDRLKSTLRQLEQARQEVIRGERLAAVGQLAAGVAHEIRNPLTTVKLLVQTGYLAEQTALQSPSAREHQQRLIIDEIDRMERTIQSLLEFARPASPRRETHDLRVTLRRVANLVEARATQQQVTISLVLGDEPLELVADREQLLQVFVNLFLNAIDAMPDGGRLQVVAAHPLEDHADDREPKIEVSVCDEGKGVPPDILDHLFEPFVTSKERGTGLGLAVSQRIVREHQGNITVDRSPDGGARFTVTLPAQINARLVGAGHLHGE
jgi:signal transduction histidine kinase